MLGHKRYNSILKGETTPLGDHVFNTISREHRSKVLSPDPNKAPPIGHYQVKYDLLYEALVSHKITE